MGILDGSTAVARVHGVVVVMLVAALFLSTAAFAQTPPEDETADLLGVADLVNLLRTVVDPSSSPVLSSPVERAVSGQAVPSTSVAAGPRVVTVRPTVTLPDIVIPDEDTDAPDAVAAETEPKESEPAVTKKIPRASAMDDDSDMHPPFYYVFFFGDYVPYYNGWFYYSDAWLWGRRGPRPLNPPGWIPPPPPPDRPFRPGPDGRPPIVISPQRGGTRTSVSGAVTQKIIGPQPPGGSSSIPGAHRIPRRNDR